MKKLPCPPQSIGEICYAYSKKEFAKNAFLRIVDVDTRIKLLIEYEMWDEAVK